MNKKKLKYTVDIQKIIDLVWIRSYHTFKNQIYYEIWKQTVEYISQKACDEVFKTDIKRSVYEYKTKQ